MTRIYMAGCGGMLGQAFFEVFGTGNELRCTDIDVNEPWLSYLDFRDLEQYRADVASYGPDLLFHLGAHTDLEYCETHPDDAYLTNTVSVENACYVARELGIPLLYIGTAGIFDGTKLSYDDWDTPNPLGVYARTKFLGERIVQERLDRYYICRAGWMMGGGPRKDKKFVNKIMMQIRRGARELFVVNDKLGTPTYTYDFAQNVLVLLQTGFWGLYNMACAGATSRLDVAREVVAILGMEETIRIVEVSSEHFQNEYFAQRPPSERLTNAKLRLRGLDAMRPWQIALREYLEKEFSR